MNLNIFITWALPANRKQLCIDISRLLYPLGVCELQWAQRACISTEVSLMRTVVSKWIHGREGRTIHTRAPQVHRGIHKVLGREWIYKAILPKWQWFLWGLGWLSGRWLIIIKLSTCPGITCGGGHVEPKVAPPGENSKKGNLNPSLSFAILQAAQSIGALWKYKSLYAQVDVSCDRFVLVVLPR